MNAKFLRARSLDEALIGLAHASANTRVLAGGTDLMVEFATGRSSPDLVIDIFGLDALRGIRIADGEICIGALTTCDDLAHSAIIRERVDTLAQAATEVGAAQIQARATIGGNLGTASPAADLTPVLMALRSRVRLLSHHGAREVPLAEFFCGYRTTLRRPDELIEAVLVPLRTAGERRAFRKVGTRRAQSISKLVVAIALSTDGERIADLEAAAGSVAQTTVLLPSLRASLVGRVANETDLAHAALRCSRDDISPIDDVRSTSAYRREVLRRIVLTMLRDLTQP